MPGAEQRKGTGVTLQLKMAALRMCAILIAKVVYTVVKQVTSTEEKQVNCVFCEKTTRLTASWPATC